MYSLVLMAAMATGPEVPEFGGGGIGWDTSLCFLRTCKLPYCAPVNCCFYETCLPTRYGWVSNCGCSGAYRYGGCYGVSYGSCFGGSYGYAGCGCGYHNYSSCYGSCYGSCHGSCYGGCYSAPTSCHGYSCSGYSCCGCIGSYDPGYHGIGYAGFTGYGNFGAYGSAPVGNPAANVVIPTPAAKPLTNSPQLRNDLSVPNRLAKASVVLEVPETAKVFVDGNAMTSTGSRRVFTTPELDVGEDYYYTVRVVFEKEGKEVEENRKVIVRPGDSTTLSFTAPVMRDAVTSGIGR
jgi:uncharacterized protein (TIGR03000 family)